MNDVESSTPAADDADAQLTSQNVSSSQENLRKATEEEEAELFTSLPPMRMPELEEEEKEKERSKGPRALRRRHGKRMDRSKLRRDAIQHIIFRCQN